MASEPNPDEPSRDDASRLRDALVRVVAKDGFAAATQGRVADEASLPTEAFVDVYATVQALLIDVHDRAIAQVRERMEQAIASAKWTYGSDDWRHQMDAACEALLRFLAQNPDLAVAIVVGIDQAGPEADLRREAALTAFVADLEIGRAAHGNPVPHLASEVFVRGLHQVIQTRVAAGEATQLALLLNDLSRTWRGGADPD